MSPDHPLALAILRDAATPIAAPSANPSGGISPTSADHVLDGLSGRIEAVIDGGPCAVGLESTIIGTSPPRLLRPGGVPREAIAACLGADLQDWQDGQDGHIEAPGQMLSHYAPQSALRLEVTQARGDEILIGFGPVSGRFNLSDSGDLREAAANLFAVLRDGDALARETGKSLAAAPVPQIGLGAAINDRLTRAAAPRH